MVKRVSKVAKRLKTAPATVIKGEHRASYLYKLAKVREIVDRFDAKKYDKILNSRPRSERGKRERKAILQKVSRAFTQIKPFVHRTHKVIRPKTRAQLEELRKVVGVNRFKGLRGIPVPGLRPEKIRVKFDRKGRATIREGLISSKLFRFRRMPRDGNDAIELLEDMMKDLPQGLYLFATRHAFLIHKHYDRDQLLQGMREFVYAYQASPDFLKLLYGVKWITGSDKRMNKVKKEIRTERGRQRLERDRIKQERAAREIAAVHKKLTGQSLKLPKLTKRARATGRR
jgi:hypothetical protein